jgi:hypothetical protein
MRTTLTIDADIAAELTRLRQERGISLKVIINETLRRGLKQPATHRSRRKRSLTTPVNLGRPLIGNIDCVGAVLEELDAEDYRWRSW